MLKYLAIIGCALMLTWGCKDSNDDSNASETEASKPIDKPAFNADTAYAYIAVQTGYGPRTPGSAAQKMCADWMAAGLHLTCDTVYIQHAEVKGGDGKMLPCINIIGSINPAASRRILLLAHWDSRPWSDQDTANKEKAIDGADDGASGVAVLMELARAIKSKPLPQDMGVDILFADVEDYGKSEWGDDSYALGTQYWAHNPHTPGYKASFGILLDMVGARNAQFPLEGSSTGFAGSIQQRVWQAAGTAGYSSYFPFLAGPSVTDDHVFVNQIAGIPTIDIINLNRAGESAFAPHWHTQADNLQVIDKNTLKAVGETLLEVIYQTVAEDAKAGA